MVSANGSTTDDLETQMNADVADDMESEVSCETLVMNDVESEVCEQLGWQMIDAGSMERSLADVSVMEQSVADSTAFYSSNLEKNRSMLIGVNTIPEKPTVEEELEEEVLDVQPTETKTSYSAGDLIGQWRDSIGNDISVVFIDAYKETLQAELDRGIGEVTKLKIKRDENGNWRCGNGILDLEKSERARIFWGRTDEPGEGTVWIRTSAPVEQCSDNSMMFNMHNGVHWAGLAYGNMMMPPWLGSQKELMTQSHIGCHDRSRHIKRDHRRREWRRAKQVRV